VESNLTDTKYDELDALRTLIAANIPVKLESLPGEGKTSYLNGLARSSGAYMHTMVAVTHDPTDFGGIPAPDVANGRYRLLPGEWATELATAASTHTFAALFLDEVNTAGRATLSALLKVVDERKVGGFALPASVRMLLAVNPAEANGGVDLTPAMANRVAHLPFVFPLGQWADALVTGFPDPAPIVLPTDEDVRDAEQDVRKMLSAYAKATGNIVDYPADAAMRSGPWASRRTWTMAARAIGTARVLKYGKRTESAVATSLVGAEAADAFVSYMGSANLQSPTEILAAGDGWAIPENDDLLFTALSAVTAHTRDSLTVENVEATARLFQRVAAEGRPGIAAASVSDFAASLKGRKDLQTPTTMGALRTFAPLLKQVSGMDSAFTGETA
jgi:hypothetical protein